MSMSCAAVRSRSMATASPLEGLLPYVLDKLKQNPEKPVILRTDPDATYGDMIRVFDTLRTARIEWSDDDGQPLHMDVHGKPLIEIQDDLDSDPT